MASIKKRMDAQKKKQAINLLKSFEKRIKDGDVEVETCGWWQGTPGIYTLRVVVKEPENSTKNPNF